MLSLVTCETGVANGAREKIAIGAWLVSASTPHGHVTLQCIRLQNVLPRVVGGQSKIDNNGVSSEDESNSAISARYL